MRQRRQMRQTRRQARRDALVIVAKYPTPGQVKTRLGATIGMEQSAGLYRAFLRDLAARFGSTARVSHYDLLWACVEGDGLLTAIVGEDATIIPQRGRDFAERLYTICRDVGALGYERTIILGSDSPQIPAETITAACSLLDGADVALGPADDGGYYLVGLWNQPAPPDIFTGVEMSTERVLAQTHARAHQLGLSVELLNPTFDVDTEADLLRLAHALDTAPLLAPHTHALLSRMLAQRAYAEGNADGPR